MLKTLKLTEDNVGGAEPTDAAYVHQMYAPLSVRLLQFYGNPGWRAITDVLEVSISIICLLKSIIIITIMAVTFLRSGSTGAHNRGVAEVCWREAAAPRLEGVSAVNDWRRREEARSRRLHRRVYIRRDRCSQVQQIISLIIQHILWMKII